MEFDLFEAHASDIVSSARIRSSKGEAMEGFRPAETCMSLKVALVHLLQWSCTLLAERRLSAARLLEDLLRKLIRNACAS
eukprot:6476503-Amphidinium_carterae.1